jgi:two-component system, NtrC family, sensor kinase
MKRRSKSGGGPAKARRRGRATTQRRQAPARAPRGAAAPGRDTEIERLTRELNQAAEQQLATSEVLRLIGGSSGDLQPVFANILESAVRLCDAHNGAINRWDGDALQLIATHNMPPAFVELRRQAPYRPNQHSASGRMLASRAPIHIVDLAQDRAYLERNPPTVAAVELAGVRTTLAVPMWKDDELVGSFSVGRTEVRPFTEKQIEIVRNFTAHAVIAVENARLLHELRETLQQQSAAADVLKVISRSTYDLQAVLDTLVEMAVRLCNADLGALHPKRANFRAFAIYGGPASHKEVASTVLFEPDQGSVMGRTAAEGKPVQVADVLADPNYTLQDAQQRLGYRTVLGVPLLREGEPIGVIVLMRSTVRPFSDKQIELAQNFADQAVIAIENMRLLTELRQRTDQLGRSVAELRRERSNKLMNMEAMAAAISHEVRQPLASIAANGSAALRFLGHAPPNLDEVRSALNRTISDSHRASEVFDNIRALFGKADYDHESIDLNGLVQAVLDALHGELEEYRITTDVALAPDLPPVMGHRGQLQEVFTNLVHNAIEAIEAANDDRRVLKVSTERQSSGKVSAAIEDSGPGIDPKQLKSIFEAFVTTKARGMGLGLALCRMIVERHAGQLSAALAQPRGSIFQVILPAGRRQATDASA